MNDIDISIIIPAYNVDEYIERTISSILIQADNSVEIILVDDGSTDRTATLAANILSTFINRTIVSQNNRGVGWARNVGINLSRGNYIVFLDGDDWLTSDALQIFRRSVECRPDAVLSNRVKFKEESNSFHDEPVYKSNTFGSVTDGKNLLYRFAIHGKMYKRSFLNTNDIRFPEGMIWEDYPFHHRILACAESISTITDTTYVFVKRAGGDKSITQQKRLTEYYIRSRFKQIDMDLDIVVNSDMQARFPRFDFYRKEYGDRLMADIKYLLLENDKDNLLASFSLFRSLLTERKQIAFKSIDKYTQDVFNNIIDGNMSLTLISIKKFLDNRAKIR